MKKLLLVFLLLTSCANSKSEYLIREFNDNGDLISETVVQKYSLDQEVLKFNDRKLTDNFEIRKLK